MPVSLEFGKGGSAVCTVIFLFLPYPESHTEAFMGEKKKKKKGTHGIFLG